MNNTDMVWDTYLEDEHKQKITTGNELIDDLLR
jgi:hypothetical protein